MKNIYYGGHDLHMRRNKMVHSYYHHCCRDFAKTLNEIKQLHHGIAYFDYYAFFFEIFSHMYRANLKHLSAKKS